MAAGADILHPGAGDSGADARFAAVLGDGRGGDISRELTAQPTLERMLFMLWHGDYDSELDRIAELVQSRRETAATALTERNLARFVPGTRVRIADEMGADIGGGYGTVIPGFPGGGPPEPGSICIDLGPDRMAVAVPAVCVESA